MWQLVIIGVVGGVSMISVALGLDKGIKRLSNFNIWMAVALLIFILVTGSTLFVLKGTFESLGSYVMHLPELALGTIPSPIPAGSPRGPCFTGPGLLPGHHSLGSLSHGSRRAALFANSSPGSWRSQQASP